MLIDGANEFTAEELDRLFNDEFEQETPPATEETNGQKEVKDDEKQPVNDVEIDKTKAFAKRLKESTDKARNEEREAIAKSLGYNSYDELQKSRESKILEDEGLDPKQALEAVEKLVKQRLDDDPRLKELEEYRKERVKEFGKKELAEITKLTNGKITQFNQLPKEVIDVWKTEGSLKSAYLKVEGEKLISELRSEHNKGSTAHLTSAGGTNPVPNGKRLLTAKEKKVWKQFMPQMTDEELNKMTVEDKT